MRDTEMSITRDMSQSCEAYWACRSFECESCPARLDGKKPTERYEVSNCKLAMILDLAERIKVMQESDTQEKIDADARLSYGDYWECKGVPCAECPVRIDGQTPAQRYGADKYCKEAQLLDLLRRQRELLEVDDGQV